jgi:hypothetical protein
MMKEVPKLLFLCLTIATLSCNNRATPKGSDGQVEEKQAYEPQAEKRPKAEQLFMETFRAHGGDLYLTASYSFQFRDKQYAFVHDHGRYLYSVSHNDNGKVILDELKNGTFSRKINGAPTELTPKEITKYTEALNSVIYFATLPYKLRDKAVNKTYGGETTIKGKNYDILEITFDQKGGGKDHDDEFMYWIDTDTKYIHYLAYRYSTSGGGVRFRSAYHPRMVSGIRFQDFINYEAPVGTPLDSLPRLYEAGKLKELSKIETANVVCLEARCS